MSYLLEVDSLRMEQQDFTAQDLYASGTTDGYDQTEKQSAELEYRRCTIDE